MSGPVVFDRQRLAIAFSEIDVARRTLPQTMLEALAQEVVKRVAENLVVDLPREVLPTSAQLDEFCEALLSHDDHAAIGVIDEAQKHGASYDALIQSYLVESARRLGTWWEEDRVSFYRVTIAAGRIYAILRILRLQRPVPVPDLRRSAVFAAVPGDSHTLGITIAADMARNLGWDIELFVGHSHDELVRVLGQRKTALIGISASAKRALPDLIRLIVALRISNPGAQIMVCGQIAARNLNLGGITGADSVAADFDTALEHMEQALALAYSRGNAAKAAM